MSYRSYSRVTAAARRNYLIQSFEQALEKAIWGSARILLEAMREHYGFLSNTPPVYSKRSGCAYYVEESAQLHPTHVAV